MTNSPTGAIKVPKTGAWPGTFESYKLVKPYILPQIWNILGAIGIGLLIDVLIETFFGIIFKHNKPATLIFDYAAAFIVGAGLQATVLTMYFASIRKDEFTFGTALNYGLNRVLKMLGLLVTIYVIMAVSLILLVVPFFFVLPRVYLAPYFLIYNDCSVSEAIAASWHSTKGNASKVYGIILLDLAIAILFITIIGIPFAVYFGVVNSGSFALLVIYLSQPKKTKKVKAKAS